MPTPMRDMINDVYNNKDRAAGSLEKTAESRLLDELRSGGQLSEVSDNPYEQYSMKELAELALSLEEGEKTASQQEEPEVPQEVLEKVAMDAVGGKVMAHAMINEFGLIKEAMTQGLCRLCKEHPMDVEGRSICSACQAA